MTDLWEFSLLLEDIVPKMELVQGKIFLDRNNFGLVGIEKEIKKYESISEAQRWINLVSIGEILDIVDDEWSVEDLTVINIVNTYIRSWSMVASAVFGGCVKFNIESIYEEDGVFIRLTN